MSTFQVNTTLDTVAVDLRTGKDATGHISLRSAIMAADAKGGSNTISLKSGTYTLTIAGANEDASATGDLDITGNLTIKGAGSSRTIIDGNSLDRVIEVLHGKVNISGVALENGVANEGAGLMNLGGQVTLSSVVVTENRAEGNSGAQGAFGISSHGGNGTDGGAGSDGTAARGGGIFNGAGASLNISKTTITGNQAFGGDGGRGGDGGSGGQFDRTVGNGQSAAGGKVPAAPAASPGSAVEFTMRRVRRSRFPARSSRQTWWRAALAGRAERADSVPGAPAPILPIRISRTAVTAPGATAEPGARADWVKAVAYSTLALRRFQGSANTFDSEFCPRKTWGATAARGGRWHRLARYKRSIGQRRRYRRRRSGRSRWPWRPGWGRLRRRHLQCRRRVIHEYGPTHCHVEPGQWGTWRKRRPLRLRNWWRGWGWQ